MRMVVIPLLAFFFAATAAQKTPKISFISGPEVVTDLGKSADLVCKVENGKEYPINWIKISGDKKEDYEYFPLSTGKTLAIRDQRFNLSYESLSSELSITLQINRIEEIDSAIYQCQVIVGIGNKITKQVQLRVKTPVKIQENSTADLTVVEGQRTSLDCLATGFPAPKVEWARKDGKLLNTGKVKYSGSSLQFNRVERTDRGEYLCVAENKVGSPQNLSTTLTIRFGPKIQVPRPRMQQAEGYDVVLKCEMDAFPAPAIDWKKDDKTLVNDGKHSVVHFSQGETTTLSTLKIEDLTSTDFGAYQCVATNTHGTDSQTVELTKTRIPIPEAAYGGSLSNKCTLCSFVMCILALLTSALIL